MIFTFKCSYCNFDNEVNEKKENYTMSLNLGIDNAIMYFHIDCKQCGQTNKVGIERNESS